MMTFPRHVLGSVVLCGVLLATPAGAQTPAASSVNPVGPVSLRDVVELTLAQSPELLAYDAGRTEAEARRQQAGRLPNPVLTTMVEDVAGSDSSLDVAAVIQPQTTVQLSQLIELGGKRAARLRLAGLDRDIATWNYEAARLDVLARVTSAFVGVLASQQAVAHTVEALGVARQVRDTVGARVAAGVVSPIAETRADVLVATAQIEVDRARRTLEARRVELATLWGSPVAAFTAVTGDLEMRPDVPPLAVLQAAAESNPDVARWSTEIERRRAATTVARAAQVPDLEVTAGYRRFTSVDSHAFVVGATIPLPLFDRNRDGVRAAEAAVERTAQTGRAVQLQLRARLAEAYRTLISANDDATTLRSQIVPGARAVFDAVREGYELGRFGLMDVLDAQRALVDANGRYLEALASVHHAVATVERLVGRPLADSGTGRRQD